MNEQYAFRLQRCLKARLIEELMSENKPYQQDAIVVSYWWD
ncbi:hypothetical protein [Dapis sp. BLCC M172]